jgi:hypothetical protein
VTEPDDDEGFILAVYDSQEAALIDVLPDMQPGDCVYIHDNPDCSGDVGACACEIVAVHGPSGKA